MLMEAKPRFDGSRISARKTYKICSKCKGKGYFEEDPDSLKQTFQSNNSDGVQSDCRNVKMSDRGETQPARNEDSDKLKMISLQDKGIMQSSSPSILPSPTTQIGAQHSCHQQMAAGSTPQVLPDKFKLNKEWSSDRVLTILQSPRSGKRPNTAKLRSLGSDTSMNSDTSDLLHLDKDLGDPVEALKKARLKLKSNSWDSIMSGLEDVATMSYSMLELNEGSADSTVQHVDWDTVGLAMTKLVASFHLQKNRTIRQTCQMLQILFRIMTSAVHRPQFDNAVNELMKRTADTSRMVRLDAQQALDSMIVNVPVQFSTRAILNQAPRHKNPLVRQTSMHLVGCIVQMVSPHSLLTASNLREVRRQIVTILCILIDDPNQHVRWLVRKILLDLMAEGEFEEALNSDVDSQILKKADRSLVLLQYSTDIG